MLSLKEEYKKLNGGQEWKPSEEPATKPKQDEKPKQEEKPKKPDQKPKEEKSVKHEAKVDDKKQTRF